MLPRLILFFVLAGFATWIVQVVRKELASLPDSKVLGASRNHAALERAVTHRDGIAKLGGDPDLLVEADKILEMMAELVERRGILAAIGNDSESEAARQEVEGIDVALGRSEQRLKEALEHLVTEQVDEVRSELKAVSTDLRDEVRARREVRQIERG